MNIVNSEERDTYSNRKVAGLTLNENDSIWCFACGEYVRVGDLSNNGVDIYHAGEAHGPRFLVENSRR